MLGVIKRFCLVLIGLILVLAGAVFFILQRGVWGLDDWVVRQVVAIVETYIVPKIEFDSFSYTAPASIELRDITLTSPGGVEVVRAESLHISLAETPRFNRPIVIERIELRAPVLRLIEADEAAAAQGVEFEGLVPFVRTENIRRQDNVDENVRLSSVLKIRLLSLIDGTLEYHANGHDAPMELSGITMDLKLDPDASGADPGWYKLTSTLERLPIFDLDIDARMNLDTLSAELNPLRVRVNLGEDTYGSLPPQLQTVLRAHEVVGKLEVHLSGSVNGRDVLSSNLESGVWIDELDFASGEYRYAIDEGRFEATLSERVLDFSRATLELLRGRFSLKRARADFNGETWPTELVWDAEGLRIEDLLRAATPEGQMPPFAGKIATTGQAAMNSRAGFPTLAGHGELRLTDGRLINLGVMQRLLDIMKVSSALTGESGMSDTLTSKFDLTPAGVHLKTFDLRSQVVAARGKGFIGFDTSIDAELNAGPMEKMQSMLGPIGKAMGAVTDLLVKYRVTGKIGNVKISVSPLGIR